MPSDRWTLVEERDVRSLVVSRVGSFVRSDDPLEPGRIHVLENRADRRRSSEVFSAVRSFYLDINHWANDDPGRWAQWATPSPVTRQDVRALPRERCHETARMHVRGREFAPNLPEVAQAADVSKMTVFNYFPRKEDLFFDRHEDAKAELRGVILERTPGESPAQALRRYCHHLLAQRHPLSGAIDGARPFWATVAASPALRNRSREMAEELRDVLADTLAAESEDPAGAVMVANLLHATMCTIVAVATNRVLAGEPAEAVRADQPAVIDRAFDLVRHGVDPHED